MRVRWRQVNLTRCHVELRRSSASEMRAATPARTFVHTQCVATAGKRRTGFGCRSRIVRSSSLGWTSVLGLKPVAPLGDGALLVA